MHYLNFSGKIHLVISHWGKFLIGFVHFSVFLFTLQIIFKQIAGKNTLTYLGVQNKVYLFSLLDFGVFDT